MDTPICISLILPTYNEAKNLPVMIEELFGTLQKYPEIDLEVIVVDDNSPDKTGRIAEELSERYPIRVIHRPRKLGLGSAVRDGFVASDRMILGVMDADLSHDPGILPRMIMALGSRDMVIGSRFEKGSVVESWPVFRKALSHIGVGMARLLTHVHDPLSGYFVFHRRVIDGVSLSTTGYKILFEILVKGQFKTVQEIPYTFRVRRFSASKLDTREYMLFLKQVIMYAFLKFCTFPWPCSRGRTLL